MPRRRSKQKPFTPIIKNIQDYADLEYDEEPVGYPSPPGENDEALYDDADRSWMYEEREEELLDEDELKDEDLWDDCKEPSESTDLEHTDPSSIPHGIDACLSSVLWFNNIRSKGFLTGEESKYMGLIVIEMSKFYFEKEQLMKLPPKVQAAVREIYRKIGESGLCAE